MVLCHLTEHGASPLLQELQLHLLPDTEHHEHRDPANANGIGIIARIHM
jgi:hypothetical protein